MNDPAIGHAAARLPGPSLPIDPLLARLRERLCHGHAVLTAPTGSGKTTRVPLAMLDADWLGDGGILMLEPRRPAARMAAARMAALLGEPVGERVGHQVRFERRIGPRTRIQVLTEGILTRRIQSDPELTGCRLLIFDEFHERGLNADLGLALALDAAAALRPDLRILVMSATLDTAPVAHLLGDAPVIEGEGRTWPVEVHHVPRSPTDPIDAVVDAVREALATTGGGDILAFLPGAAEIHRTLARLSDGVGTGVDLLPLHGSLSLAEQDRALRPDGSGRRRVVLATDIAETSLTIEGVSIVIDSGLTRKPRFAPGSGLTRLVTEPIPASSAEQRTGRAGRLGPGRCLRLWTQAEARGRPAHRPPEILNADLAPLVLELALWGLSDPAGLAWLDPPPPAAWSQGVDLLRALGAIDASGAITGAGRRMAALPAHPRLAHMLTAAPGAAAALAADLAALLSERDPWVSQPGQTRPADLRPRLQGLAAWRRKQPTPSLDIRRLSAIDRLSRQFRQLLRAGDAPVAMAPADPGRLLALAYPERIAQNRDGGPSGEGRFLLANGTGAILPRGDALLVEPYLVVANLDAAHGDNRIRAALPIAAADLEAVSARRIERVRTLDWDEAGARVSARNETRLGAILLDARPRPIDDPTQALRVLLEVVRRDPAAALSWSPRARQLQGRVALAAREQPDAGWPDLSDLWLHAHLADWLGPWLGGKTRLADVRAIDIAHGLGHLLGWERIRRIEHLAPEMLTTPAGTQRRIDYSTGPSPVLAVPIQEMYGAIETPTLFDGRLPLLLHLLSPAGRALQITSDLSGFWRGAYAEVRKAMRGRYPKHHWPEDPATASPVAGGLKRRLAATRRD